MQSNTRNQLFIAAVSAGLICLLVYLRALGCGFVNLDDPVYVVGNSAIRQLDLNLLVSVFTKPYYFTWLPLTYLSFAIDYYFWQLNPLGYHLTNILLHVCNVGLVVFITDSICRQKFPLLSDSKQKWLYPAMLVLAGILFGLHPLRVEAVTWVSQRKDVLNGLFTLGSVLFYLRYVQKKELPGQKCAARRDYCLSVLLFLCSLMAKQVSVVLPLLLLTLDWFPLGRIRKGNYQTVIAEKLPYFALSLAVSILTIYLVAKVNVMISAEEFPLSARFFVSGNAVFEYWRFLLYPVGIVPYFVIGDTIQPSFVVKTAVVIVVSCYCIATVKKRPLPCAVWIFFLIPLLPVLAFTQSVDDTSFASRYSYLPSVAPSIAVAILLAAFYLNKMRQRPGSARILIAAFLALLVIGYGAMTSRLISAWQNTGTLWTRQIEIQPLGRAYSFRGVYYFSIGSYDAALEDFDNSLKIAQQAERVDIFNLFAYKGETLRALGRHEEAIEAITAAISLYQHTQYYYFRGCSLQALGRFAEAEADFRSAGKDTGPIIWFQIYR